MRSHAIMKKRAGRFIRNIKAPLPCKFADGDGKGKNMTKIAKALPFEGAPKICVASVFGASPTKPIIFRISAIGERPMTFSAEGLVDGLTLSENIITGSVKDCGEYEIILIAKNRLGEAKKKVIFEIKEENVLVTPLLGFTSWNAFGSTVSQDKILATAHRLIDLGIAEYGYSYVNTDSGWQYRYGGEYDAIMPNSKFPDMRAMTDELHSLGFKCGIYSTPMLRAWGCPAELESIPGCTQGEPDKRFAEMNGGIGVIRKEKNNALQWDAWGFDYLKYDWDPTDPVNAEYMREQLVKCSRDFGFCVTVRAMREYHHYWSRYVNSFRSNFDSLGSWQNLIDIYNTYFTFGEYQTRGHYFDLDMLDIGTCNYEKVAKDFTEDEMIVAYTMRAFLSSPIQISSTLENISDFEMSLYCNEEILAISQDCAFSFARPIYREDGEGRVLHMFERQLEDGSYAYAIFNLGEIARRVDIKLATDTTVRDPWLKQDIAVGKSHTLSLDKHSVRVLKSGAKAEFSFGE